MIFPRDKQDPKDIAVARTQVQAMYEIAKLFDYTYIIDLYKYGSDYDEEFKKNFFVGGHMNVLGYEITAKKIVSYIDYIIRHNATDLL